MDQGFMETALKMSMALGAVLVVFAGCIFCFRKFSSFSQILGKRGLKAVEKPIDVLSHQSLGPGKSLYLVRCGGKKILIGSTNQSIQHIATMGDSASDDFDFESSLSEQAEGSASEIRKDIGRSFKDVSRV